MKRKLDFDMQTRPLDVQIKFRLPIRQNFDNFFTQLDENRILSTQETKSPIFVDWVDAP
jgi:hypothetical protein